MRAHTLARVALLAVAGSMLGCGTPGPAQADRAWKTAGTLPPASGLAGYHQATGTTRPTPTPTHHPSQPRPDWDKPDGHKPGWGKPGWGWNDCPPWMNPYPYFPPMPFPYYVPPVMTWGPFSPIPLVDVPGPLLGPVAPLFGGFGTPWGW